MTSASNEVSFPAPVEVVDWEGAGSFSVDSGTAALIPAAHAGQVSASSDPRSFFDDLVACLDASGSSELAVADGVLVCRSGLGDGVYSVWRGDDASGDPAALELQFLPLGDEEFTTVATFDVPGPLLVADPSYVGFADAGTAAVRWLPEGTYLVQAAYSELEFWGRRLAALCLVRPAA